MKRRRKAFGRRGRWGKKVLVVRVSSFPAFLWVHTRDANKLVINLFLSPSTTIYPYANLSRSLATLFPRSPSVCLFFWQAGWVAGWMSTTVSLSISLSEHFSPSIFPFISFQYGDERRFIIHSQPRVSPPSHSLPYNRQKLHASPQNSLKEKCFVSVFVFNLICDPVGTSDNNKEGKKTGKPTWGNSIKRALWCFYFSFSYEGRGWVCCVINGDRVSCIDFLAIRTFHFYYFSIDLIRIKNDWQEGKREHWTNLSIWNCFNSVHETVNEWMNIWIMVFKMQNPVELSYIRENKHDEEQQINKQKTHIYSSSNQWITIKSMRQNKHAAGNIKQTRNN